jgi:DNA-binding NarL/FixJ family response regulator
VPVPLPPHATLLLTPRDREICDLLITGADNADIAATLSASGPHLAERTVKCLFGRMYMRNQLTGTPLAKRVKLAVYYFREKRGWTT